MDPYSRGFRMLQMARREPRQIQDVPVVQEKEFFDLQPMVLADEVALGDISFTSNPGDLSFRLTAEDSVLASTLTETDQGENPITPLNSKIDAESPSFNGNSMKVNVMIYDLDRAMETKVDPESPSMVENRKTPIQGVSIGLQELPEMDHLDVSKENTPEIIELTTRKRKRNPE